MARKIRSDATIGSVKKRLGNVSIRSSSGRQVRSDCKLGNLRKK